MQAAPWKSALSNWQLEFGKQPVLQGLKSRSKKMPG
jgi:hypothetical protein